MHYGLLFFALKLEIDFDKYKKRISFFIWLGMPGYANDGNLYLDIWNTTMHILTKAVFLAA